MLEYMNDLEKEDFHSEVFVERQSQKLSGTQQLNTEELYAGFIQTMKDLETMKLQAQRKQEKLQKTLVQREKEHWKKIATLQARQRVAFESLKDLEASMAALSGKLVPMGQRLESLEVPRARAQESHTLLDFILQFHLNGRPSDIFTNPKRLDELSEVIQKLYNTSKYLPPDFGTTKRQISLKYRDIEKYLVKEFTDALKVGDVRKMKAIAHRLSPFSDYSQCIAAFVDDNLKHLNDVPLNEMFTEIPNLCRRILPVMDEIFVNPDVVASKFIDPLLSGSFREKVVVALQPSMSSKSGSYLDTLSTLYFRTQRMVAEMSELNLGTDSRNILKRNQNEIFAHQRGSYASMELRSLEETVEALRNKYYQSLNHQKRPVALKGFSEMMSDVNTVKAFMARLGELGGDNAHLIDGETYLSEVVAINILEETKASLKRCDLLCEGATKEDMCCKIFNVMINAVMIELVEYAVDLGLKRVLSAPTPAVTDGQTEPVGYPDDIFLDVVRKSNSIAIFFNKQFHESVLPLISASGTKHAECMHKKKTLFAQLETKLNQGLQKHVGTVINYVKYLLQCLQRRGFDKTPAEDQTLDLATPTSDACNRVVRYIKGVVKKARDSLDGPNLEAFLGSLGLKFHRTIYDHILLFSYSSSAAMNLICDLNLYRKCAEELGNPMVTKAFDVLHALCNLLIVPFENLTVICSQDQLMSEGCENQDVGLRKRRRTASLEAEEMVSLGRGDEDDDLSRYAYKSLSFAEHELLHLPETVVMATLTPPNTSGKASDDESRSGDIAKDTSEASVVQPLLEIVDHTESALTFACQVCVPFLIAGMGMVAAGLYLDVVQHWKVFKHLPEIFIMVPALLGLKGNLEMTLASRLSTHANLGNMDTSSAKWSMAVSNLALVQCQALVVAFLASMAAMLLGWGPQGTFNFYHASLLCAAALLTASLASFVLGLVMIFVVLLSRRLGINPDNVATPVAASLGDITTLVLLSGIAELLFHEQYLWLSPVIVVLCLLSTPLWVYLARQNHHTRVVLLTGWTPVISAMVISSFGGLILDLAIVSYKGIAVFQPVINGVGGNLAAVQSSRLSTYLHRHGNLGQLPPEEGDRVCVSPWGLYLGKSLHAMTARVLLSFVIPGHLVFCLAISVLKRGHTSVTPVFVFFYDLAALLQVGVLLYVGHMMVLWMWRRKIDPDNSAIPYLTALGDLLGTGFLASAFYIIFLIGDQDNGVGD
ncbi:unnamed protein product [Notodromas monacha]|uniref:Solute carrier family 41 member 1 n=1 Tax=Notodromas monacha TaxID=399045 RepID=A0A7R9G9U2_9CRUS|nr:unnamed protein product [Notodromas monacha]CAG0913426.1 unnamed protein product [Notodromas monacha]